MTIRHQAFAARTFPSPIENSFAPLRILTNLAPHTAMTTDLQAFPSPFLLLKSITFALYGLHTGFRAPSFRLTFQPSLKAGARGLQA